MALINCSECGKEVSDKAAACPGCGAPVAKEATNSTTSYAIAPGGKRIPLNTNEPQRKCLKCGYVGPMKTWLRNYIAPQFITIILLLFWVIPGLIFIAWGWGKHKCPQCGKLAESIPA